MKLSLTLAFACLPWAGIHAQNLNTATAEPKASERVIRMIVAGQRPMPEFGKQGDQYVEVEPSAKWIMPSSVEFITNTKAEGGEPGEDGGKAPGVVWPNEVANLGKRKCSSSLRLRLLRKLSNQASTPQEIDCDIGGMKEPLIVICSANSSKAWDDPQIRVIDLAPDKVPLRSVVALNLTGIPLTTRFESEAGQLAPAGMRLLHLPANKTDVFRFRIDAQAKESMVTLANSSYQIGPQASLILLAVPNLQVPAGAPPLSLQLVMYHSAS